MTAIQISHNTHIIFKMCVITSQMIYTYLPLINRFLLMLSPFSTTEHERWRDEHHRYHEPGECCYCRDVGRGTIFNQLIILNLERLICTFSEMPASGARQLTEPKCQRNTHASIMHELWTLETIKNKLCKMNHYYSNVPDIIHRQLHRKIASGIINGAERKIWNSVMKWWTGLISHFPGVSLCSCMFYPHLPSPFFVPNSVFALIWANKKSKTAG